MPCPIDSLSIDSLSILKQTNKIYKLLFDYLYYDLWGLSLGNTVQIKYNKLKMVVAKGIGIQIHLNKYNKLMMVVVRDIKISNTLVLISLSCHCHDLIGGYLEIILLIFITSIIFPFKV